MGLEEGPPSAEIENGWKSSLSRTIRTCWFPFPRLEEREIMPPGRGPRGPRSMTVCEMPCAARVPKPARFLRNRPRQASGRRHTTGGTGRLPLRDSTRHVETLRDSFWPCFLGTWPKVSAEAIFSRVVGKVRFTRRCSFSRWRRLQVPARLGWESLRLYRTTLF